MQIDVGMWMIVNIDHNLKCANTLCCKYVNW